MEIKEIKKALPHRYPFLLIDKVIEFDISRREIIAQKNITINENFFNGHFPDTPIMPGVLVLETMAQSIGILASKILLVEESSDSEKKFVLVGVDKFRIKRPLVPGDVLKIHSRISNKIRKGFCKGYAEVYVDKLLAARAEFLASYTKVS